MEVLRLLAVGKPNQQIAEELVVALNTVKKHVAHILTKLGASNRTEATARARELGLLPLAAAPSPPGVPKGCPSASTRHYSRTSSSPAARGRSGRGVAR